MDDKLDVTFQGILSKQSNCLCNCCHDATKVLKISIPETLYFDGKSLSTKYHDLWICESCTKKLVDELKKIVEEKQC